MLISNLPAFPSKPLIPLDGEPLRDIVVVIDASATINISFHSLASADLYRVSGFLAFVRYFETVFRAPHREITIVIVGSNPRLVLDVLLDLYSLFLLSSLHEKQSPSTSPYAAKFLNAHRYYISQIHPSKSTSAIIPSIGENDRPVPFNLVFVIDLGELSSSNSGTSSTMKQQFIRFLALKHGGLVILSPHIDQLLANAESIMGFKPDPKPIFHPPQNLKPGEIACYLHIPLAWDSWSKILILGKSAPHHKRWDSLETLLQVNREYDEILESPCTPNYQGLIGDLFHDPTCETQVSKPDYTQLTLNDILSAAVDQS